MTDIHVICPHQARWRRIGDNLFETGDWTLADATADEVLATGGNFYLHEKQRGPAWHGGSVVSWRPSDNDPSKKVLTYRVTGPFRVAQRDSWAREMAIVMMGVRDVG
jgi:hypothetical protein